MALTAPGSGSGKPSSDDRDLARLPVLGIIPPIEEAVYPEKLIVRSRPHSIIAEAFGKLAANIEATFAGSPPRVLLLTSPGPTAGKNVVLANIAVALAQSGRRVIVVDADRALAVAIWNLSDMTKRRLDEPSPDPDLDLRTVLKPTAVANLRSCRQVPVSPQSRHAFASLPMRAVSKGLLGEARLFFDTPPVLVGERCRASRRTTRRGSCFCSDLRRMRTGHGRARSI
jgi:hypothetical protein